MKKMIIAFKESLRISANHKMLSFLLAVQICCALCLSGSVINYVFPGKQELKKFKEDVLDKSYFSLHEFLDDTFFTMYMGDENYGYQAMKNTLYQIAKENQYTVVMEQPISLYDENIPQVCREGYEDGESADFSYIEDDKVLIGVKSYQISGDLWNKSGIRLEEGEYWEDSEVDYKSGKEIPVILGHEYKEKYSLGDILNGEYLGEIFSFRVSGFIKKGVSFTDGEALYLCDRYLFLPSVITQASGQKVTEFDKMQLLQQYNGVIITKNNFEETEKTIKGIVEDNGLNYGKDIILTNPREEDNVLENYSAMSDTLLKQYVILLTVLIFFVIGSSAVTITGFVKKHKYDLGVFLLCGAKEKDIYLVIGGIVGIMITAGDIMAMSVMALSRQKQVGIIWIQAISVAILVLSSIVPCVYIKRSEMNELVGGKE